MFAVSRLQSIQAPSLTIPEWDLLLKKEINAWRVSKYKALVQSNRLITDGFFVCWRAHGNGWYSAIKIRTSSHGFMGCLPCFFIARHLEGAIPVQCLKWRLKLDIVA